MVVSFFIFTHFQAYLGKIPILTNIFQLQLKLPTRTCPSPDIRSPLATGANREPPHLLVSEMVGWKKHGKKPKLGNWHSPKFGASMSPFFHDLKR